MVHRSDCRVRIGFPFAIGRRGFPDDWLAAGCGFRPAVSVPVAPIHSVPLHPKNRKLPAARPGGFFHVRPEYWCGSVPYRLGKLFRIPDLCRANEKNGFSTMSVRLCEILNYGDVCLFHETISRCPGRFSLWGDPRENGDVMLEPGADHRRFTLWRPLAVRHRYCRLAKRSKFQDYRVNLTYAEMRKIG